MALANYTLAAVYPTAAPAFTESTAATPLQHNLDDLLYSPEDHQPSNDQPRSFRNSPYSTPAPNPQQRRSKLRKRAGTAYLPPPNQFTQYPHNDEAQQQSYISSQLHTQVHHQYSQHNTRLQVEIENQRVQEVSGAMYNGGEYIHDPSGDYDYDRRLEERVRNNPQRQPAPDYASRPQFFDGPYPPALPGSDPAQSSRRYDGGVKTNFNYGPGSTPQLPAQLPQPQPQPPVQPQQEIFQQPQGPAPQAPGSFPSAGSRSSGQPVSSKPPGFTKVESGGPGGKTRLHAVLDYDEGDYYDDIPGGAGLNVVKSPVTPLQGPITLKNGTVPVVPLYSYQTVNNGSFFQIPILWTALSLALGYELGGHAITGVPCVKRNYQLYCPTAGNTYPLDKIESFIDENKALMKRMYGVFGSSASTPGGTRRRREAPGVPDIHEGDSYFRHVRQANRGTPAPPPSMPPDNSTRVDACESNMEITTPYWALNSGRKLRAIVNTMHFEQAIHQEVCSKTSTSRCAGDCGCEQKYKWHRLLAYDPSDDCAGIFMDWFLFPSCCVCRCNP